MADIDPRRPVRTRDGAPAEFVAEDRHPLYPLTYRVRGRLRSYTRTGRYAGELHDDPLDLFPEGQEPDGPAQLVLAL